MLFIHSSLVKNRAKEGGKKNFIGELRKQMIAKLVSI